MDLIAAYEQKLPAWRAAKQTYMEVSRISNPVDREIAQFMHRPQRAEELREIVQSSDGTDRLSPTASRALQLAKEKGTVGSYLALDREMKKMLEEEEFILLTLMVNG